MTADLLTRLRTIRACAQRLAELGAGLAWADYAADLDAPIDRLTRRARREFRRGRIGR